MLYLRWWFQVISIFLSLLLGAILVEYMFADESLTSGKVRLLLNSGRQFQGELFSSEDSNIVVLQTKKGGIKIRREILKNQIQSIVATEVNTKPEVMSPRVPSYSYHKNTIDSRLKDSEILDFQIAARLAQLDSDLPYDGLLLSVSATDHDRLKRAGSIQVVAELFATKVAKFNSIPQGRGFQLKKIGRWSHQIQIKDQTYFELPLVYQAEDPETDFRINESGVLLVRIIIPGENVIERRLEPIRIRSFSPTRDYLELQRIRFH